jgi:hypothetical protein
LHELPSGKLSAADVRKVRDTQALSTPQASVGARLIR